MLTYTVISSTLNVVRLYLYSAEIKFCYDEDSKKHKPAADSTGEIEISKLELRFLNLKLSSDDINLIIDANFTVLSDWLIQNNMLPTTTINYTLCVD
ncbi:MAG: hypothetical protein AB8W37_01010 [Arsenophonus endosymbiont of Dermacentor nuttalli]